VAVAPLCGRIGMRPTIALDVIHARCAPLQQCHCCTLMNTASRPLRSVPAAEQQRDGGRCEAGLRLYRHRPGRLSGVAAWAQLQAWENLSAPHRLAIEPHVFSTAVAAPLLTSAIWQLHWHFAPQIADLLDRMALTAEAAADGGTVRVQVPPTRSDVLHACDVFEVRAAQNLEQCLRPRNSSTSTYLTVYQASVMSPGLWDCPAHRLTVCRQSDPL